MPPALRIRNLSKTFPGVRALRGVDLDVQAGSVHAILGHNGCGKSTLVKALAGVHAPDPGCEAWIDGAPLVLGDAEDAERQGLRFVHQELGIVLELGAMDNLGFVVGYERGRLRRIDWRAQERMARELLERFGFGLDPHRPMAQATPPERTAVAIVRAVAGWQKGKGVLILDEPTAALPAREVDELFRLVREVRDSGTAVILVSHRLDEVMAIADHATVMRGGRVVWDGSTADMTSERFVQLIADAEEEPVTAGSAGLRPELEQAPIVLSARGLAGRYARDVDLDVRRGEIVGIAGLLGSGREELPYLVAGALAAQTTGAILVDGVALERLDIAAARRAGIVLVPADRAREGIIGAFSAQENVTVAALDGLARWGIVSPARERAFARRMLDAVGADPGVADRSILTLSGGNQQKTILARWLAVEPKLLALSEPTAGVDIGARIVIYEELRRRAVAGLSVLVASSDVEDLLALCDRVLVMRDGAVVAELALGELSKPAIVAAMEGVHSEW